MSYDNVPFKLNRSRPQVLHKRAAVIVLECTIAAEAEHRQRREASGVWPAEVPSGIAEQDDVKQ